MTDQVLAEIQAETARLRALIDDIRQGLEQAKAEAAEKIVELMDELATVKVERDANARLAAEVQLKLDRVVALIRKYTAQIEELAGELDGIE